MEQLMQKLMISKQIMDRQNSISRTSQSQPSHIIPNVQDFDMPQAKYNIPQEFLSESPNPQIPMSNAPRENTKPVGVPSLEAIQKSKLPDEIKRLMIEHPIAQPNQPQNTLSDELVEKASRLMKSKNNNYIPESAKPKSNTSTSSTTSSIDYNVIQKLIEDSVRKVLKENGLLQESVEKSNETFSFKVGKHLFEGRVTKIKKLS